MKNIRARIQEKYSDFTQTEKQIADYFLTQKIINFSSKSVAKKLFISESSLSRFAKKIGYQGYREFVYNYKQDYNSNLKLDALTRFSIQTYNLALEQTYHKVNNFQMIEIANMLESSKRIYINGIGSSALIGQEFSYRLTRIGKDITALGDNNEITMNISRVHKNDLILGISISGKTEPVLHGLKEASKKGAKTVLLTAGSRISNDKDLNEIVQLAKIKNLPASYIISPQFPAMIMLDILYTHLLNLNRSDKINALQEGLDQINFNVE